MLGISDNIVRGATEIKELKSQEYTRLSAIHLSVRNLLLILLGIFLIFMFLPWTQNIRGEGQVTTLRPEQRPQTIHSTIAGRIEHWYVTEGQAVRRGDTIVYLSEVKTDYFDPDIVERVGSQVQAKTGAIESYSQKVGALEDQIAAMRRENENKIQQIQNKIQQAVLKIESDQAGLEQAKVEVQIAKRQFEGIKNLYDKGLKSLTELEEKKAKLQENEAKIISAENKLASARNDLEIYRTELQLAQNEYANKIAKAQSDKFSTLSEKYDAQASVSKLKIERENYSRRQGFYYIVAPQDGFIVRAIKPGIGEMLKEGDPVVSILPADYQLAVEMYVRPMDLPLLHTGRQVRFMFDGWPAFVFSGWPGVSTGTYAGRIVAIDRNISANGKFRILVAPDPETEPCPSAPRGGGGAKGIALLDTVPVWYEFWRILNGFPPDFYQATSDGEQKQNKESAPKKPIKNAK